MRRITTRGGGPTRALDDALRSTFVAEFLSPSSRIWLLSPWVSDIPVLDNRGGELSALVPGGLSKEMTLTGVLRLLAGVGTEVIVIVRPDPRNDAVVSHLRDLAVFEGLPIHVIAWENLHDKGLLTDHVYFEGSMNFTHYGRNVNEEGVTISRDPDLLSRMKIDLEARFGGHIER